MQTQPTETAIVPTAHEQRLRAIVKRLVIDLGYLEHCSYNESVIIDVAKSAGFISAAVDCLNEYLDSKAEKITPMETIGAEIGNLTAVYPPNPHED